jgi:ABC-type dipeptide/oligopeptide/nickel transport system permease component
MLTYIARRILYSVPVLIVASFLTFWGLRIAFDPLAKYRNAKGGVATIIEQRKRLGLNHPLVIQWWNWFTKAIRGDLGTSDRTNNAVMGEIIHRLGTTVHLIVWSTALAAVIAVGVGVYSAVKQYSVGDYVFTGISYLGLAMPPFWFGLMAILLLTTFPVTQFHLKQPIFYSIGLHSTGQSGIFNLDYFRHLALPVLTLIVQSIASWSRFERASMLDVLSADYVRTARAKGVPRRKVIFKHAFRNALIPLLTVMALDTAFLFGGLIITEQIFAIPGMGRYFLESLTAGDAPALTGWVVITALFIITFNLLADIMYSVLDPRIRLS